MAVLSVVLILAFIGCNFDPYYGKRPFDYGAATWVCENPSAWFVVNPDVDDYYQPEGEIQLNDETMQFKLFFVPETNLVFFVIIKNSVSNNEECYDSGFDGECIFSPEKLVIKVDKDTDTVFDGQYDELVFTLTPTEDEESDLLYVTEH